jgi:hypothetical protein
MDVCMFSRRLHHQRPSRQGTFPENQVSTPRSTALIRAGTKTSIPNEIPDGPTCWRRPWRRMQFRLQARPELSSAAWIHVNRSQEVQIAVGQKPVGMSAGVAQTNDAGLLDAVLAELGSDDKLLDGNSRAITRREVPRLGPGLPRPCFKMRNMAADWRGVEGCAAHHRRNTESTGGCTEGLRQGQM